MMKLHKYKCLDCGLLFTTEDINAPDCPTCGSEKTGMYCLVAIHGNYKRPIHSDSLAIHPSQRAEHRKMFPNIEVDKLNRPVFGDFVSHRNYLEKCNLVKHSQKIRLKGKKI